MNSAKTESDEKLIGTDLEKQSKVSEAKNTDSPSVIIPKLTLSLSWIGCFIWFALNILLLCCIVFYPVLPHTTIVLNEQDHNDFLTYAFKLMELLDPGCTQKLTSLIPNDWAPNSTRYDFYHKGICRAKEGLKRICYGAEGERLITGLIEDIGFQMAEHANDTLLSSEWSKSFYSAIKSSKLGIKLFFTYTEATGFVEETYREMRFSGLKGWAITSFVFFVLCSVCAASDYFTSGTGCPFSEKRSIVTVPTLVLNGFFLLSEILRFVSVPFESLNDKVAHGLYFFVVFLLSVWQLVYFFLLYHTIGVCGCTAQRKH